MCCFIVQSYEITFSTDNPACDFSVRIRACYNASRNQVSVFTCVSAGVSLEVMLQCITWPSECFYLCECGCVAWSRDQVSVLPVWVRVCRLRSKVSLTKWVFYLCACGCVACVTMHHVTKWVFYLCECGCVAWSRDQVSVLPVWVRVCRLRSKVSLKPLPQKVQR